MFTREESNATITIQNIFLFFIKSVNQFYHIRHVNTVIAKLYNRNTKHILNDKLRQIDTLIKRQRTEIHIYEHTNEFNKMIEN